MNEGYSLADIRAATEGREYNNGFGCGGDWWVILLFLFAMGGNGFGGFGNGYGVNGALTRAEMQQGFDTQEVVRKLDGLTNGLSDGFYAQAQGFANVTTAVRDAQFAAQQCCCETNRNIDAVRYDAQKNACDITTAIHAEGEETRALIRANEIQTLRDKVAELQLAQSQCAQNAYLVGALRPYPVPAYQVSSPYVSTPYGCGCGNGFGGNI